MNQQKAAEKILSMVAHRYGLTVDDVLGSKRSKEFVAARWETAYVLRTHLAWTYPRIGHFMGKDHTTIIHALQKFKKEDLKNSTDFDFIASIDKEDGVEQTGFYLASVQGGGRWTSVFADRGGKCEMPGCGFNDVLEIHHLISKKVGGTDETSNLLVLCPSHHALLHGGQVRLNPKAFPHINVPKHLCTDDLGIASKTESVQ